MSALHETHPARSLPSGGLAAVAILVVVWLVAVVLLARAGVFHAAPDEPPIAILLAIVGPPLLFLLAVRLFPQVRGFVLGIDPVWLTAIQGLRVLGGSFLLLYAVGALPGLFAHPAGWGDMLVGFLAPFAAARLARDPGFLASKTLWRFHLLGLADFVAAVGTGVLARGGFPALTGEITSNGLGLLPLVLIPGFAVPLWICLHAAAMLQIRAARRRSAR